jgi:hypothetical protein
LKNVGVLWRKLFVKKAVLIILLTLINSVLSAENWPLGFPSGNFNNKTGIPADNLRKIAALEAKDAWGSVKIAAEIPCVDADGNISVYMFVYRINGEPETYDRITSDVREGRRIYSEAAAEGDREKLEKGKKLKWGIGRYGTIVMSAIPGNVPVIERIHGLPPFYTSLDIMQAQFSPGARLSRIFYFSPVEQYYEFQSGSGTFLSGAFPVKKAGIDVLRRAKNTGQNRDAAESEKIREIIKQQWRAQNKRIGVEQ